jgi:hypothetical protein
MLFVGADRYFNLVWIRDTIIPRYGNGSSLDMMAGAVKDFFGADGHPDKNIAVAAVWVPLTW